MVGNRWKRWTHREAGQTGQVSFTTGVIWGQFFVLLSKFSRPGSDSITWPEISMTEHDNKGRAPSVWLRKHRGTHQGKSGSKCRFHCVLLLMYWVLSLKHKTNMSSVFFTATLCYIYFWLNPNRCRGSQWNWMQTPVSHQPQEFFLFKILF